MDEKIKRENRFSLSILSKYRSQIYGFAALWVIASHIADYKVFDFGFFGPLQNVVTKACSYGNAGVDIFLLLSGISLYFSWSKTPDLSKFLKKRAFRILPSYIMIVAPIGIMQYIGQIGDYPRSPFLDLSTLGIWIDGRRYVPWYVSGIIAFYLIYPLIHTFIYDYNQKYKNLRYILLMVATYYFILQMSNYNPEYYNSIYIIISRIPVFITGCFMGKFVKERKNIKNIWLLIAGGVLILHIFMRPYISDWRYYIQYIIPAVPMTLLLSCFFMWLDKQKNSVARGINRFMKMTGSISFEIYLTHVLFYRIFVPEKYYMRSRKLWILGMVVSYVAAIAVKNINDKINKKYL